MNKVNRTISLTFILTFFLFVQCDDDISNTKITDKQWKMIIAWQLASNLFASSKNICNRPAEGRFPATIQMSSGETITDDRDAITFRIPITQRDSPTLDVTLNSTNCRLSLDFWRCYGSSVTPAYEEHINLTYTSKTRTFTVTQFPENQFALTVRVRETTTGNVVSCSYTIRAY
jgi:hypothetical protein